MNRLRYLRLRRGHRWCGTLRFSFRRNLLRRRHSWRRHLHRRHLRLRTNLWLLRRLSRHDRVARSRGPLFRLHALRQHGLIMPRDPRPVRTVPTRHSLAGRSGRAHASDARLSRRPSITLRPCVTHRACQTESVRVRPRAACMCACGVSKAGASEKKKRRWEAHGPTLRFRV